MLIFSLHADSYYKEEGRLEDGQGISRKLGRERQKKEKRRKKRIVPIEKRGSSADVDLGVLYNLAKKEAKAREKTEKKYEALWKEAIQEKNDISDLKWEETMEDLEEIEEGAMEE
ncbi:Uncharacterised protein [Fusobacterium necrophorum subsp. necrophorum]|nr:Uncharacterised protein [Fusobacterium necrophorum subsp. necrophorum]